MPKRKLSNERYKNLDSLLQAEQNDVKNRSDTAHNDDIQPTNENSDNAIKDRNASSETSTSEVSAEQAESPDTATQPVSNKSAYAANKASKARNAYKPRNRGAVAMPTPGKQTKQPEDQPEDGHISEQNKQEQRPTADNVVRPAQSEQVQQGMQAIEVPPAAEDTNNGSNHHSTTIAPEVVQDKPGLDDEESVVESTAKRPSVKIEAAPSDNAVSPPERGVSSD